MKHDSSTVRGVLTEDNHSIQKRWRERRRRHQSPPSIIRINCSIFFFPIHGWRRYLTVRRRARGYRRHQNIWLTQTEICGFMYFNIYSNYFTGNNPRSEKNASHLSVVWLGAVFVRIFGRVRAGLPRGRRDDFGSDPWGRDSTWNRSRARCWVPQVQQGKNQGH